MRYAYYMKTDIETVRKMTCVDFKLALKHMEAILAEDRYILQRQLDNHTKLNTKETIKNYVEIYEEFSEQMKTIGVVKHAKSNLTKEEKRKMHEENLAKTGLKVVRNGR